jgi:hypothetical protein
VGQAQTIIHLRNEDFSHIYAINTHFGQNAEVCYVKEGGTHSDRRVSKRSKINRTSSGKNNWPTPFSLYIENQIRYGHQIKQQFYIVACVFIAPGTCLPLPTNGLRRLPSRCLTTIRGIHRHANSKVI